MNKNIISNAKTVFLLSNAFIRYYEIFFNTDGDFEFINAIYLCIEGHV